jgi:hypothetical protein
MSTNQGCNKYTEVAHSCSNDEVIDIEAERLGRYKTVLIICNLKGVLLQLNSLGQDHNLLCAPNNSQNKKISMVIIREQFTNPGVHICLIPELIHEEG